VPSETLQPEESYEAADPTASDFISTGNDFFNQQQYDSADKYYDRALSIEGSNMEAVYGKGIVLYQKGRVDESVTMFNRAYEGGFRYAWLSWVLADVYDKRGQTAQAVTLYKESVNLDSTYTDSYKRLAELEPVNRAKYLQLVEKYTPN
jgi:tetratricopeptide (TPR) repeat protein